MPRVVLYTLRSLLLCLGATLASSPQSALALDHACDATSTALLVDRGKGDTTPCTLARHDIMLEAGYYQNASALGGTQQAAYPLAHLRYGLSDRTEVFIDPATRIAKSGLLGKGIYKWSRSGGGIKQSLYVGDRSAIAVRAQYTPQSDETTSLSTRERFDIGLDDRFLISSKTYVGASIGNIVFTQETRGKNQESSLYGRIAVTRMLSDQFSATALLNRTAHIAVRSAPQTNIGLSLHDQFGKHIVGDAEIGTALNGTGNTKAHYIGFGISARH